MEARPQPQPLDQLTLKSSVAEIDLSFQSFSLKEKSMMRETTLSESSIQRLEEWSLNYEFLIDNIPIEILKALQHKFDDDLDDMSISEAIEYLKLKDTTFYPHMAFAGE